MNEFGYHTSKRARRRSPRAKRGFGKRTATTTALWPGVRLINSSGRKIVVQWKQMPDGTRMALLMGDNISSISGDDDELGFIGALLSAAPALFSMVKKVAPGLMATAGKLAGKYLPGAAGKLLKGVLSPATKAAQRAVAAAPQRAQLRAPAAPAQKVFPGMQPMAPTYAAPPSRVKHLPQAAKIPAGYSRVIPVSKVSEGAFID